MDKNLIRVNMKAGEYYIGDLKYILNFEDFEISKTSEGKKIKLKSGQHCINFMIDLPAGSLIDNTNFKYSIDSYSIGIVDAGIIDEELLSSRYFALRNGVLSNKFSGFALAKVVRFDDNFEVVLTDGLIDFGGVKIALH